MIPLRVLKEFSLYFFGISPELLQESLLRNVPEVFLEILPEIFLLGFFCDLSGAIVTMSSYVHFLINSAGLFFF